MKLKGRGEQDEKDLGGVLHSHWAIALIAALSLPLLFTNLGSDYLWADEGDTAILASNIVKYGIPRAWDGVTFTDSDKGARLNEDLVMVSHPWLQYYLAAGSFLVFGESTFTARLPFALVGWMTILLIYALVRRVAPGRGAASWAAVLTMLSVQFLLYSRQCRNYSLNMFFTCWLFWCFFRMRSIQSCVVFAVAAILLFHTHPLGLAPLAALGILTLIYRPFQPQRRWFWFAFPAIALCTLPWFALARGGYEENGERVRSTAEFFQRFTQYLIESTSVTPLIGITILLAVGTVWWKWRTRKIDGRAGGGPEPTREFLGTDERSLVLIIFATLFLYGVAIALTQSTTSQWFLGIRYATALIPLMAMIAGILIARLSRGRMAIWAPLVLLFGVTKLAQLTPWTSWADKVAAPNGNQMARVHVPEEIIGCFLTTEQLLFVRDLRQENPGTIARISQFLRKHASSGDLLIANYGWEPLYFHTRLPQALKILPDYPAYQAARRQGLPDYVFGVDHVRWVVWRPLWEDYQGYRWANVEHDIFVRGGFLKRVEQVEETFWENRENIHFHRFSGGRYCFPQPTNLPPALIFRVEWLDDEKTPQNSQNPTP